MSKNPVPDTPAPPRARWTTTSATSALNGLLPLISAALAVGLIVGLILVSAFPGPGEGHVVEAAAAGHAGADSGALPGAGKKLTLEFEEGDMYIKPNKVDIPAGADVTVHVVNKGSQAHSLSLAGTTNNLLDPGKEETQHWGVIKQSTEAWCTVAGHKDAGMLVAVNVTGGDSAATTAGSSGGTTAAAGAAGAAAQSNDATIDAAAKPAAGWKPHDPVAPPSPADGQTVHDVTFTITEQASEVAPGVKQVRWTFNGTAPGPTLRGKVGDTFNIKLVNKGTMAHSIDFHASKVAPNVQMRTIKPGESLDYRFTAQFAGIFTYHCGADPMIYHMGNGMYGAVIIDPPDLGKVDQELVMVQSELYLGPQGQPGSMKKMMANENDAVVFNGYYNQYLYSPIKVKAGSRVRVWVDDSGPNENLAFHVVGSIFDTVWKEGHYTLRRGNPEKGGSQVLDLQPTQGGFVEFTLPDAGTYPFVGHKMANLSRGALGVFAVS